MRIKRQPIFNNNAGETLLPSSHLFSRLCSPFTTPPSLAGYPIRCRVSIGPWFLAPPGPTERKKKTYLYPIPSKARISREQNLLSTVWAAPTGASLSGLRKKNNLGKLPEKHCSARRGVALKSVENKDLGELTGFSPSWPRQDNRKKKKTSRLCNE